MRHTQWSNEGLWHWQVCTAIRMQLRLSAGRYESNKIYDNIFHAMPCHMPYAMRHLLSVKCEFCPVSAAQQMLSYSTVHYSTITPVQLLKVAYLRQTTTPVQFWDGELSILHDWAEEYSASHRQLVWKFFVFGCMVLFAIFTQSYTLLSTRSHNVQYQGWYDWVGGMIILTFFGTEVSCPRSE